MPPQKTGSTSIAEVLVSELGAHIYRDWKHILEKTHDGYLRHLNLLPEEFADYFVFSSIRNPYRRISSLYEENKSHNRRTGLPELPPFGVYLERRLSFKNSMCGQLVYESTIGCVEFEIHALVRMETMQEDFNNLPFCEIKLPHLRKSTTIHRYSPKMAEAVLLHHGKDFEKFGYSTEIPQDMLIKEFA